MCADVWADTSVGSDSLPLPFGQYLFFVVFSLPFLFNNANAHLVIVMVLHIVHINNGELSARICYNLYQIDPLQKWLPFFHSHLK